MDKKRLVAVIYLMIIIISPILYFSQEIYAEDLQTFQEYNLEINFDTDFEYKAIEYNFLGEKSKSDLSKPFNNFAYISQQGNRNEGSISQIGNFASLVSIIQIGNENRTSVKQYANNTTAEIFQFGNNHDLSLEQWGNQGKVYVIQSGNNLENKEVKIIQF